MRGRSERTRCFMKESALQIVIDKLSRLAADGGAPAPYRVPGLWAQPPGGDAAAQVVEVMIPAAGERRRMMMTFAEDQASWGNNLAGKDKACNGGHHLLYDAYFTLIFITGPAFSCFVTIL